MYPQQIDDTDLDRIPADRTVLIAGPTASGKSALALRIAVRHGGIIVNADASQVYDCWRVLTARPTRDDETRARHRLYGHITAQQNYSTGHWLREVTRLLDGPERLIIVGGTGLYFSALTEGLADIPTVSEEVRGAADALTREAMLRDLDAETLARIDKLNPVRVQRAWEVLQTTGQGLAHWQDTTPDPALRLSDAHAILVDAPREWLMPRLEERFDIMLRDGALEEVRAVLPIYDPSLPAHRAIGAPELVAHLHGEVDLEEARARAIVATRQYAKRQRTWFRARMKTWAVYRPKTD
ncbi:MAG: tRNA (adenosine(37)-N6)-dimethylallyltransferase MiaA [Pseudomonadota bacterium]